MFDKYLTQVVEENQYDKQAVPELERLLEMFIDGVLMEDVGTLFRNIFSKNDFISQKARFHEYVEILEYLKRGFPEEKIQNGEAYDACYKEAHPEAVFREYQACQDMYKEQTGETLPMLAFALTEPMSEITRDTIKELELPLAAGTTWMFYSELVSDLKASPKFQVEEITMQDVEKAMRFYEIKGFEYKRKDRILETAEKVIKRMEFIG
ncbi:MAG: hypothetical protein KKF46_05900 [Nanoarchaeota archaeon]|nr:hypothetical protein [Nanoarchaeota archaeon]MBU1321866.1 hypothetical protein [Nanoarchaeota archaeon]MBU1597211.1 hypothetical protein [Nanoarchaeota archaeon]MBU2441910.1 hypothetical protein [Nanoarchaeota archaeon]